MPFTETHRGYKASQSMQTKSLLGLPSSFLKLGSGLALLPIFGRAAAEPAMVVDITVGGSCFARLGMALAFHFAVVRLKVAGMAGGQSTCAQLLGFLDLGQFGTLLLTPTVVWPSQV